MTECLLKYETFGLIHGLGESWSIIERKAWWSSRLMLEAPHSTQHTPAQLDKQVIHWARGQIQGSGSSLHRPAPRDAPPPASWSPKDSYPPFTLSLTGEQGFKAWASPNLPPRQGGRTFQIHATVGSVLFIKVMKISCHFMHPFLCHYHVS